LAYQTTDATDHRVTLKQASATFIPEQGYSILVYSRQIADGTGKGVGPLTLGDAVGNRATPYFNAGTVYFDFGGATEGATRVSGACYTNGGSPFCFIGTTGPRGMELWSNGRLVNSNAANPTRLQNSYAFVAGDVYGGSCGTADYFLIVPFASQLSQGDAQRLSANPWQIFKPRKHILYFDVGGGGGVTTAADSSSFALTGSSANGVSAKVGVADASSYTITGSDANGAKSIVAAAESSTYTITGSDANAIRALVSAANSSSYVITGSDAQGVVPVAGDTPSAAGSSSYTITGSDSLGIQAFVSAANSGSYVITGVDANASKSIQAVAESGSYTITGSETSITRSFASEANSSSYVIEVGTAHGVYSGEPTVTLGAGSRKKKKETKQYLVDGVLRELTDEQAAQIMYDAVNTAQQPKKIVLEDKPEPLDVPEELKKKSIFRPENLEKPKAKAKTPKPVFAKEVIKVTPEHVVVKQVDDDETLVLQWLEGDAEDRRLLAKQLQQLYISLSGRR
jgi:hypothetical protein